MMTAGLSMHAVQRARLNLRGTVIGETVVTVFAQVVYDPTYLEFESKQLRRKIQYYIQ